MKVFGAMVLYASEYAPSKTLDGIEYLVYLTPADALKMKARGVDVHCDPEGKQFIFCRSYNDDNNSEIIPGEEYDLVINVLAGGKYSYLDLAQNYVGREVWVNEFKDNWDSTVKELKSMKVDFSKIPITCVSEVFSQKRHGI